MILTSALPNTVPYSYIINPKVIYLFIPVFHAKYSLHNPNGPPVVRIWLRQTFPLGMLKGHVYEKNPPDLSVLKSKIKREIAKVTEAQLSDVFENLKKRVQMCESENGKHFQHPM